MRNKKRLQPTSFSPIQPEGVIRLSIASPKFPDAHVLIDERDYELISQHAWSVSVGSRASTLYAVTTIGPRNGRKTIRMHRMIMGVTDPAVQIDHINGEGLDNRRSNLRRCTQSQNAANRIRGFDSGYSSKYRGVSWHKRGKKWIASIRVNGQHIHLGSFSKETDAALAYDEAAIEHFGQFARLNFLREIKTGAA